MEDWITTDTAEGKAGKTTMKVKVAANSDAVRTGTITLKDPAGKADDVAVTVAQGPVTYILVNSSAGASVCTIDGVETTVAAGETISGACETLAFSGAAATSLWEEVHVSGDVAPSFGCLYEVANTTLRVVEMKLSEGFVYNGNQAFAACNALETLNITGGKLSGARYMLYGCIILTDLSALATWDVSAVTDMTDMFGECTLLADISALAGWDVSNVTNMTRMFRDDHALTDLSALAGWDVSNVTDMQWMFYDCTSLTDLSALATWDVSAVTDMNDMFRRCTLLADISALAGWDVSNVTDMTRMFRECTLLATAAFDGWDMGSCTDYTDWLYGCSSLTDVEGAITNIKADIDVSPCPLTRESALVFLNGLSAEAAGCTITFSSTTKALLTDDDIAIATEKGWTVA